jgi:monolysocardiolipin acyltransferase
MILATAVLGKTFLRLATKVQTKNLNVLLENVWNRPPRTPLITLSNHTSCVDDAVLWSLLPYRMLASVRGQRWVPGAKEVIFTNSLFTYYFSRGKLVPVVRGNGVYQEGMDFLISKLQDGAWVHIYPEGKIIADHSYIRHKWGVGRLVAECTETPTVIPLWHVGMDDLLPNRRPYIPQLFQVRATC